MQRVLRKILLVATMILAVGVLAERTQAQVREFDFYTEFRQWRIRLPAQERRQVDEVARRYREKLTADGVAPAEIERRITLIRTRVDDLEADFWNRFFTEPNPGFNTEPNAFLVSVAEGRKPGRALDVGMGEGRNALYLAKLGWDVTGFDPAEKAVALANERASKLGLKITTRIARDTDFDFGTEEWDLILYSWVAPMASAKKAIDGLKPGGIIVLESGTMLFARKDIVLDIFKPLHVLQHNEVRAKSDYFERQEMDIIQFLAEKPR